MSLFPTKYGTQGTLTVLFMSVALFVCFSLTAFAGETVISNSINVSAESGGNTATGGDGNDGTAGENVTVSGQTHSSVDIETTVNDEIIESIHEESNDGKPLIIETTVHDDDVEVSITAKAESSEVTHDSDATTTEESEREDEGTVFSNIIETVTEFIAYVFSFFRA